MTKSSDFTPLNIADVEFLVEQRIEGCPSIMLLREFVKNGLEAEGNEFVRIYATNVAGTPKLTIWNDGRGMSSKELERTADLAMSGKVLSRAENFGMGAKVAGLRSNKAGVKYRSCHDGRVVEMTLKKSSHRYGRTSAVAISRQFSAKDRRRDWTEVVLLGNRQAQNTVLDPYDGQIPVGRDWVLRDLHQRFFDLPTGVTLIIRTSARNRKRGDTRFIPIAQQLGMVKQHETVQLSDNLSVTYIYDPKKVSRFTRGAVEHRDEMYSVLTSHKWNHEAMHHGILYGQNEISVLVHLARGYPVQIEDYRRHLISTVGEEEIVSCQTFREQVARHLPDWLREIINAKRPSADDYERSVEREMLKLFRELGLHKLQHLKSPEGGPSRDFEGFTLHERGERPIGPGPRLVERPQEPGQGKNRSQERDDTYPVPKVQWLETADEIATHELEGNAGRFVEEAQVLFLNRQYRPIQAMEDVLVDEYGARTSPEARSLIDSAVRRIFYSRTCEHLAVALKHRQDGGWSSEVFECAMSPPVLSVQADMALLHGGKNIRHARDSLKKRLQKAAA